MKIRSARNKKNPNIFRDEYVTSMSGKRKTAAQTKEEIEVKSVNKFQLPKKTEWTYDEVNELTKHFMSFEWNNREIQRYNLYQNLSPSIFWHYVSNQYFPLKTYIYAQNFDEYFEEEVREKFLDREIDQKEILSLYNIDQFTDRTKMCKEKFMIEQLLESSVIPVLNDQQNVSRVEQKIDQEDIKSRNDANNTDCMIEFCERYLEKVKKKNGNVMHDLSEKLQLTYDPNRRREIENKWQQEWIETGVKPEDVKLWNLHDIYDSNQSVYYDVAAAYLED